MLTIDGSQGEGGGQILRTSIALAAALGRDVRITNIRAGRTKGGLAHQHLAAVQAAAAVCDAEIEGDQLDSTELVFRPGEIAADEYHFDIGTAGSTALVLQTVIPALTLAAGDSTVTVTGGTHNPFAPCFEYLRDVFGVLASAANVRAYFEMIHAGFYPAGGGEVRMELEGIDSMDNVSPIRLSKRGELKYIDGVSAVSANLPGHIAERQTNQVINHLAKAGQHGAIEQALWDTHCPGTAVFMRAVFSRSVAGFSALGERGKAAERVADEAVLPLLEFIESYGVVDAHAADQLVTIAALCPYESRFLTQRVSDHLLTNATIIHQLTGRTVHIHGQLGTPGEIIVREA